MAAVSVVWHDYRSHKNKTAASTLSSVRKIFPVWSLQQLQLVELVKAIKVFPFESIVQTVRQVLKQPPTTASDENVNLKSYLEPEYSIINQFVFLWF